MAAYSFTLSELLIMAALVFLAGAIVVYLWVSIRGCQNDQQRKALENELDELRDYKLKVNAHYRETAQQFQQLTGQYRSLYEHMAHGASSLCDEETGEEIIQSLHSGLLEAAPQVRTDESDQATPDKHYLEEDRSK